MKTANATPQAREPTSPVHSAYTYAEWCKLLAPLYAVSLPPDGDPARFEGRVTTFHLPHAYLVRSCANAQSMERSRHLIDRYSPDHVSLFLLIEGRVVADYDGLPVQLDAGDIVFIDYHRPIVSHTTDFDSIALIIERKHAPVAFRSGRHHGSKIEAARGATRLLSGYLRDLLSTMETLAVVEAQAVVRHLLTFAGNVWTRPLVVDPTTQNDEAVTETILTDMRAHMSDPEMSPMGVATRLGISRARLYRLLEPYGGVSTQLNKMRLEASMETLIAPRSAKQIAAVAVACGFKTSSQFSRAFKAHFGLTPREVATWTSKVGVADTYSQFLDRNSRRPGFDVLQAWLAAQRSERSDRPVTEVDENA